MAFRKLSDIQKRIIACCLLKADSAVNSISKKAKVAEPTARRVLDSLREQKVLKPFLLVDIHAIGFTDYCMAISLYNEKPTQRKKFIQFALSNEKVAWLAELSGRYHFSISIFAKSEVEALSFFQELGETFPEINYRKYFSIRTAWNLIAPADSNINGSKREMLSRAPSIEYSKFDQLDHQILRALNSQPLISDTKLAKQVQTSLSTLQYRLNRLRHDGLLRGIAYYFEPHRVGMFGYRLFIEVPNNTKAFSVRLLSFALKNSYISTFVECLGNWDYELNCEVEDPAQMTSIKDDLHQTFPNEISHIQILQVIQTLKIEPYPFKNIPV